MRLRQRMLLVFAATVCGGMLLLYFLTRGLLMSSFTQLEVEQMKQNVEYAETALSQEYRQLGMTTNDYAYWDRMYEFMANPKKGDIGKEFQNGEMEGLGLNLVVIRDFAGKTVFAKAYDSQTHQETGVPENFLHDIFQNSRMNPQAVAGIPQDGMLEFPDGTYLVSLRPILTSQRSGEPRGVLLIGRRFNAATTTHVSELTRTSVSFERIASSALPEDFRAALKAISQKQGEVLVRPITEKSLGGYTVVRDLFDQPLFLMRVDTLRPIHERGKLSQLYLFAAVFAGAVLSSMVIIFFLQRFVLSRVFNLGRDIQSIGRRKAITERVAVKGRDELSNLAESVNDMLAELEKSQTHFLFLSENIQQIFWIRDAASGEYEYVSRAFEKIWGMPREALRTNPMAWRSLVHPDDQSAVERMVAEQARGKAAETYYRILLTDGTSRWLWERTYPSYGPDSKLKQIIGITEDVTEFKENEQALLRAQEELENRVRQRTSELAERGELVKLLMDSAPDAMYGIDIDGIITFCNQAGLRLLGYSDVNELLGKSSHTTFHHTRPDGTPYPQAECPVFASFRDGRDAHVADEFFWKRDGTGFPVEYSSRQIRRRGKAVGAVVTFLDTTDHLRQEMELRHSQKLEAVGRLAAGIAHEINTPIQFVGDNTRFLQTSFQDELKLIREYEKLHAAALRGEVSPGLLNQVAAARALADWEYLKEEIPRATEQMLEGLKRVSTIVRGMKEFSHVDRSNEKVPGDLNRALESTLIVARNELKYVADVETQLGELPPVVCHLGDLNQVFLNLLVNAAHAIEDVVKGTTRKGKITVRTRRDGDFVEVAIGDSGTGIPEEAREKIFDPFFTTKAVGKGTGQGLALARAIVVEKHGGTLTYETAMGKGTTFYVRLPLSGVPVREEALTL